MAWNRAEYNPDQYLWERDFTLAGRTYIRQDLELTNARGHTLRCSHYLPSTFPRRCFSSLCIILASGNRADANEAAVMLLPSNITVFTLDFSGSGLSDGDYVSLGWHERDDLKVVVSYLRSNKQISRIGLWGRSMGAVTCLLYGAEDPSIAGMVLDSAFSNLYVLMMELVDVYKIRLPKLQTEKGLENITRIPGEPRGQCFYGNLDRCILGGMVGRETRRFLKGGVEADEVSNLYVVDNLSTSIVFSEVKMAVQYMRRIIEKKAKFDIMDLNCLQVSSKTFIPALFGHAKDDKFIPNHHSDLIYKSYAGDKNIIYFDGDHNSSRPQFYYDSVSIFFYNVLHPPQISSHSCKLEKYYDLGDLKIGAGLDEGLLYEIITGVHSAGTDVASSSSAPPAISTTKCVGELLSEIAPVTTVVDSVHEEADILSSHEPSHLEDQPNDQNEECCSYTSSNRESWGRCSSLGGSDEESSADCTAADNRHPLSLSAYSCRLLLLS
ncbi:unnamed protein product [Prunus armeniaca]|uniref:Serine aminopeptidase S33 domain-containing protein n=1 Tax=Prunus armeniaca TaxID=36596 RepID=A0A6J5UJV3_PRUAR|nr:unnamed protein product [Prunus armeniaca]